MEAVEIIINLSTELAAKRTAVDNCIAIIRGLCDKTIDPARITFNDAGGLTLAAPEAEGE